jgi:flagella basal body P-ring formation protein FlgA
VQSLPAGRPLTRRDVIERPVVRKGQLVEVVAQQGALNLSMKALALESGAAGDLIKLRNLESRREFCGQVLHESKVQVQF